MLFNSPGKIVYGRSSVNGIAGYVPGKDVMLVTGKSFAERTGLTEKIRNAFGEKGIRVSVFKDVPPEPGLKDVEKCLEQARKTDCDSIIAAGGGI